MADAVVSETEQLLGMQGLRCDHGSRSLCGGRLSLEIGRLKIQGHEVGWTSMPTLRAVGSCKGFVMRKTTESQVPNAQ